MRLRSVVIRGRHVATLLALSFVAACGGAKSGADAASAGSPAGGAGATPGVVGDTITLGALIPLSDAVALIGKPILAGAQAYFNDLNARKGGIGGRYRVRLLAEDITYANPSSSVQKYNKIKDRVAGFVPILGTDHINVTLPLLAEDNALAVPSTMDAEWVREPHLISVLTPYQLQMINGVDYWLTKGGGKGKTLCAMVMSTGYGLAAVEGAQFIANAMGTTVAATAKFRPGDQDFVAPITQLKNAKCDAVALASLPTETAKIMGAASQLGFTPRWIGTSPTWHAVLGATPIARYAQEHLWIAAEGAEWGDTTATGMQQMLDVIKAQAPDQKPDTYFAAGYTMAESMAAVLEAAAKSGDLSRAGIAKALTTLGVVAHGGVVNDYRYGAVDAREPSRVNSLFAIDPSRAGGYAMVERDHASATANAFTFTKKR